MLLELRCAEPYGDKVSRIYFLSLDSPESAEGSSVDWVYIDEARLVDNFGQAFRSIASRLRGSGHCLTKKLGLWITTTPNQIGSYMYNFFVDPQSKDPASKFYQWKTLENVHLPEKYRDSMVGLHQGYHASSFLEGKFVSVGNLTFDFDVKRHLIDELPNTDIFKNCVFGVDWGWTSPSCILAVLLDGDKRAYVVEEYYKTKASTEELIEAATKMHKRWGEGRFYCDKSNPEYINKFVEAGLRAYPNKKGRQDGVMELGSRFADAGDGKPRIFISSKCQNLIRELQGYVEENKKDDHAVDALRYALGNIGHLYCRLGGCGVPSIFN